MAILLSCSKINSRRFRLRCHCLVMWQWLRLGQMTWLPRAGCMLICLRLVIRFFLSPKGSNRSRCMTTVARTEATAIMRKENLYWWLLPATFLCLQETWIPTTVLINYWSIRIIKPLMPICLVRCLAVRIVLILVRLAIWPSCLFLMALVMHQDWIWRWRS